MNPLTLSVAVLWTVPFWSVVALVIGGPLAVGWTLIALACCEFGIGLLAMQRRPPRLRLIVTDEERIGAFDKRGRLRFSRAELRRRAA